MISNHRILWAPDIIKESNGVACGDMLSLSAYRENDKLFFSFNGNSCEVALKVAEYLEKTFSGNEEYYVKNNLERLRKGQYKDSEQWIKEYLAHRKQCVESPISLLYEVIAEKKTCEIDTRNQAVLACDACVSTKSINWKPNQKKKKETSLSQIAKKVKNMDNPLELEFQELGLCVLTEKNQKLFSEKLKNISEKDFILLKKLRLAALLYNNALKYGLCLDKKIEELAVKQIVSLNVATEEIKIIDEYIRKNGLMIDAVKGGKTNRYYPSIYIRTHMDFDYLAAEFDDAFKFISFLINSRNFKLVVGGSVPFSLKSVLNMNSEEVLTGHIHLEKILQDKYQVVVDVNMGGFPLGRTGIIQCNNEGKVELEDLICITISHLFKHEHAFMKDINDLYYLLSEEKLNKEKLIERIQKYELTNLFYVVNIFLKEKMGLSIDIEIESIMNISKKRIDAWPFSREAHFYLKALDMFTLNCKQFGEEKGTRETINQICGARGEIATEKFSSLISQMNERVYLYPVVIFQKYMYKLDQEKLINITSGIWRFNQLLVLPIGIFLIQDDSEIEVCREKLNDEIINLLNILGIDETICNTSYVMEARKDTWLY